MLSFEGSSQQLRHQNWPEEEKKERQMQILLILPFRNLEPPLIKTTYNGLQFISSDHGKPTTSDTRSHLFKARVALWMMACKSPSWWTCPGASHSLCLILMIDFNTWKDPFPLFEDAKMLPELQKEDQLDCDSNKKRPGMGIWQSISVAANVFLFPKKWAMFSEAGGKWISYMSI